MADHPQSSPSEDFGAPVAPPKAIPEHELIRCIGRGSYGDVWLGKSVLGAYRAIKVVYRKRFPDAHPYEREFTGIQQFEPVSRSHSGLVDVLQVGRNDEEGYFYYIMELGDAQHKQAGFNPATYEPKTLATEKQSRGRFSFAECLQLSIALASALEHLHKQGLVHRDIKPSNIIFVNDAPKLADIGLVAEVSKARSFVGTEGYIPPEGPGNPQADLYSLGKVIYEMATGKDRQEFPVLPLDWDQTPEHERLGELNEIILKACEKETHERYETAQEMLDDLMLLQAGKSIKRLRLLERRWARLLRYGSAAAVIALVSWAVIFLILREHRKEREFRLQQARASVAYGSRLMEEGDLFGAFSWFAEGLRLDHEDPKNEYTHRVRLRAVSRQCPRLEQCWVERGQPQFGRFSPDGRLIAIATSEGAVEVYDARTGQRVAPTIYHGRGKGARTVCFSPDGKWLLTTGSDNFARRWNTNGQEILPPFKHPFEVFCAEYSPDGTQIVTGCKDHQARIWEVASGELLQSLQGHGEAVLYASFSRNGQKVVTASQDFSAWIWDVATGKPGPRVWHKNWVYQALFSPDDQYVATASFDNIVQLWHASSGQPSFQTLLHPASVASAEFSPDGRFLATAGWDFAARVWNLKTGELANTPLAHEGQLMHCSFSPQGRHLLTLSMDRTVRLWDLECNSWMPTAVSALFSPDGSHFYLLSNGVVRIGRDWINDKKTEPVPVSVPIREVIPNRSGHFLLAISQTNASNRKPSKALQVYHVGAGPVGPTIVSQLGGNRALLSDDALRVMEIYQDTVQLWDSIKGEQLYPALKAGGFIQKAAFAPNTKHFVLLQGTNAVLYETRTGNRAGVPLGHPCAVLHAEFSPDSRRLVTACSDRTLEGRFAQVWSVPDGELLLPPLNHKDGVLYATFSPDGRVIATASEDFTVRIWDANSGQELVPPLRHRSQVYQVKFSPSGRWVVTASSDGAARVWDVQTGDAITPPLKHPAPVREVQFIADAKAILTHMEWGVYFVWDLSADTRTLEEIEFQAEFLSGHQLRGANHLKRRAPSELLELWRQANAKNGLGLFGPATMHAWHERQAESAERQKQSFAGRFHVERLMAERPNEAALYARRAELNADLGCWKEAEQDWGKAMALGANEPFLACQRARVSLALGTNQYRARCQELSQRVASLKDQKLLTSVSWVMALSPGGLGDRDATVPFLQQAGTGSALNLSDNATRKALGALQYRAGRWEDCIKTLTPLGQTSGEGSVAEAWLFLAMAHAQLGQVADARTWLARAQDWFRAIQEPKPNPDAGYHLSWTRRLDLSVLAAEAQATLDARSK